MPTSKTSLHTKRQMANALRKKMETKPLNKITIQEIVGECGLNRQTFYYHFQDIYDLLHWIFEQDAEQLLQDRVTGETWQEALMQVLNYIEQNRKMCLCVLESVEHDYLNRFLYRDVEPVIWGLVEEASVGIAAADLYKQFLTRFYTLSLASLIVDWLISPPSSQQMTKEELVEMVAITVEGNLRVALERYAELHPEA
ncbi:MAG: TetR/AcrR family transcriptional regulator C-terminal domain-containing protein [Oscillospiraceae bacterium]|nr:TetR/AcrR family transcriptional regulator C-terminal domain-containing protein [Oscillospiraceae bacterium]